MPVLCVHGTLRQLAGGGAEHQLEGPTVIALLRELERTHPDVSGWTRGGYTNLKIAGRSVFGIDTGGGGAASPVVVDGRNVYHPERMGQAGFVYASAGRPTVWAAVSD